MVTRHDRMYVISAFNHAFFAVLMIHTYTQHVFTQKFLRLMGGGKKAGSGIPVAVPGSAAGMNKGAIGSEVGKKVQQDLEKQFEQGRKLTQKLKQGKRVGLGA